MQIHAHLYLHLHIHIQTDVYVSIICPYFVAIYCAGSIHWVVVPVDVDHTYNDRATSDRENEDEDEKGVA